jgi:EAL domain-containing protein (putative c-di-GMP-specific phosphodiesterase class I)/GGDEF domain-containing protein
MASEAEMKAERDRFVAFAFAAADAFLELDNEFKIIYAVGATQWLAGVPPEKLIGQEFLALITDEDRLLVQASLATAQKQGRFGPVNMRVQRGEQKPLKIAAFGSSLPTHGGRTFVALSALRLVSTASEPDEAALDPETGLLNKEAFSDVANEALKAGKAQGLNYDMTLIDLDGIDALREKMGTEEGEQLLSDISAHLQANSVNGSSAGRIDGDKFGIVHEPGMNVDELNQSIADKTKAADPDGEGMEVTGATVNLDAAMSEEDNAKALVYTINKFSESQGDFTIDELSDGYKKMMDETQAKIKAFKTTIATGEFDALFQPIVELSTRFVHHYEGLARLRVSGPEASPFAFITFAEEVGVIGDFDLAMIEKIADKILKARQTGDILSIAVNVSGRSIESPMFLDALHKRLKDYSTIREELMFELTESSKIEDLEQTNNVIQGIRELGHHVCLDDFGSGAAAYQYLRALEVDYVKIDGIYVQEALSTKNGKAFLKSMSTLCKDIQIHTVAEMIEDEETATFLQEIGVRYGQGYLFGKPGVSVAGTQHLEAS